LDISGILKSSLIQILGKTDGSVVNWQATT